MAKNAKRTAVIFVHGQGDQSPMDDLVQLAYTIWETDPKAAAAAQLGSLISVPMSSAYDGDIRQLITDKVNGRQFHFYQFYWAHLMEGNAVIDVWRWLIRLLQRPKRDVPKALLLARGMLRGIVVSMAVLAVLTALLTSLRLLSPPLAYGALAANAYAALWAAAALSVLALSIIGRRMWGVLIPLTASVIAVGALFGWTMTNIVAGDDRILKQWHLPEVVSSQGKIIKPSSRLLDVTISFACVIDSNLGASPFRNYCEHRVKRPNAVALTPGWDLNWWHLASAAHRAVIASCLWGAVVLALMWSFASPFLKNVMADSARYFSNEPRNVAQRDKVRSKGVSLLDKLHSSGKYDRIVVVAHSLGTVVAYDMLDHYWGQVSGRLLPRKVKHLYAVESAARDLNCASTEAAPARRAEFRQAQRRLSRSLARSSTDCAWAVTDLITLGSPLTYAPLLVAGSNGEFIAKMRKLMRLPSAPPAPVERVREGAPTDYNFHGAWVGRATGQRDGTLWPSAMFAAIRWTNIYFTHNRLSQGDIVGGPIAPVFGRGILDIPIDRHLLGRGFLHNEYWKWPGQTKTSPWAPAGDTRAYTRPPYHIARLRQAANLFEGDELEAQLLDPAFRA